MLWKLIFFNKNIEIKLNVDKVKYICPVMKIGKGGKNLLGHTAPYPINLVENIRELCNENSVILDPYLGSGTTVLWAKENKYKCIGIEINKDYYNLAINRINKGVKVWSLI